MQDAATTTPVPDAATDEVEPTPEPLAVQTLLFKVKRVANGAPPKFALIVNGNTRLAETNPSARGVSGHMWSEMGNMSGDAVMMSKAAFLALLKALQTKDGPDIHITGCNGYPISSDTSPFGVKNVGKKVTFG